MSWNTIGFFARSPVSRPMLSDLRLKASGSGKPFGFTSFTPAISIFAGASSLPKSVSVSVASSNAPEPTAARTSLIVTLSITTFVLPGSFSFFSFGPSFLLTSAMMRSKLLEPAASNT